MIPMNEPSRWPGKIAGWTVLLVATLVASDALAEADLTKTTAVAPNVPGKTRLVHVQLGEVTAVAARKGWLQEEFAKYNAKVDLVSTSSFGSSGTIAALYDRGDLHIGGPGMLNVTLEQRVQGLDIVLFWEGVNVHPRKSVVAVLPDSNFNSVTDLKGQTLGGTRLGCTYYAATEALRAKGVTVDNDWFKGDMRYVDITGSGAAVSAFLAGRFQAWNLHPSSAASLYVQKQIREVATALPGGLYVTAGGRGNFAAPRRWVNENPDLARAYLAAWDRTVRWLYADHGAHLEEAATIISRETRVTKAIALFKIKDEGQTAYNWGVTDYGDAVSSIKRNLKFQIANGDPFFAKHPMTDKEIESFVDRRFFAGGEYFFDTSEKARGLAIADFPSSARP
jgi:ABC-type nitrate/sulfonate/bicarbonate transport system substrate-binding protein